MSRQPIRTGHNGKSMAIPAFLKNAKKWEKKLKFPKKAPITASNGRQV
jgi:hypothetical protein